MNDIKIDGNGHFIINHVNVTETLHQIAEYNDWPSRVERLACKILAALDPGELRNAVVKVESVRIEGVGGGGASWRNGVGSPTSVSWRNGGGGGKDWVGTIIPTQQEPISACVNPGLVENTNKSDHSGEVIRLRAELAELKTAARRVVVEANEQMQVTWALFAFIDDLEKLC